MNLEIVQVHRNWNASVESFPPAHPRFRRLSVDAAVEPSVSAATCGGKRCVCLENGGKREGKREPFSSACAEEASSVFRFREALPAFQKHERRDPVKRDFASFSGIRERRITIV